MRQIRGKKQKEKQETQEQHSAPTLKKKSGKEESAEEAHPEGGEQKKSTKRQSATNAQPEMPKKVRWNPDAAAWGQAAWRRDEKQGIQPSADAAAAIGAAAANAALG